jgi:phosphate:Na+ symporter
MGDLLYIPSEIWWLLAGLGIFLLGMHLLEESIKVLAGGAFTKLIRNATSKPLYAVSTGTTATAVLQSSSAVTLLLLAFAGAGVLRLEQAIGVIFGSNIGTTITAWLVTLVGFKISLETISLPIIGIGGLGLLIFGKRSRGTAISKMLTGFGLLFLGLGYMRDVTAALAEQMDMSVVQGASVLLLVLFGFVITALVQASLASFAIILSFLHGGLIDFHSACALVIGANLGTTVTVMIGSLGGSSLKRQIALSHLLFNGITALIAIAILHWIEELLLLVPAFQRDYVLGLAAFHSLFNVLGVVLLFPFIGIMARILGRWMPDKPKGYLPPLPKEAVEVPDAALDAFRNQAGVWLDYVMWHIFRVWHLDNRSYPGRGKQDFILLNETDQYDAIGLMQEDLLRISGTIQKQQLSAAQTHQVLHGMNAIRYGYAAAKLTKDSRPYIVLARRHDNAQVSLLYQRCRDLVGTYAKAAVDPDTGLPLDDGSLRDIAFRLKEFERSLFLPDGGGITNPVPDPDHPSLVFNVHRAAVMAMRQWLSAVRQLTDEEWNSIETHEPESYMLNAGGEEGDNLPSH